MDENCIYIKREETEDEMERMGEEMDETGDEMEETVDEKHHTKTLTVIPETSKSIYNKTYETFNEWRLQNNVNSFSEDVLLTYFTEISRKYKPNSLWSFYSIIKCMLKVNHNVDLKKYGKLRAFLRRRATGFQSKISSTLTMEEIKKFIDKAPDKVFLLHKVILIIGVMGACRSTELYAITIEDVKDLKTAFSITIPKNGRTFTINSTFYNIVKKYIDLRPSDIKINAFFLNYYKSKCIRHRVGKNKFANIIKQVAKYLNLPDPQSYTGHCYRRSSASLYIDKATKIPNIFVGNSSNVTDTSPPIEYINCTDVITKDKGDTTGLKSPGGSTQVTEESSSSTETKIPNIFNGNSSLVTDSLRPIEFINCTITNDEGGDITELECHGGRSIQVTEESSSTETKIPNIFNGNSSLVTDSLRPIEFINCTITNNEGGDITGLESHGGGRPTQVTEASSSTETNIPNISIGNSSNVIDSLRPIQFINCTITNVKGVNITELKSHGGRSSTQVTEASSSCTETKIPYICIGNSSNITDSLRPIQFINCTINTCNLEKYS